MEPTALHSAISHDPGVRWPSKNPDDYRNGSWTPVAVLTIATLLVTGLALDASGADAHFFNNNPFITSLWLEIVSLGVVAFGIQRFADNRERERWRLVARPTLAHLYRAMDEMLRRSSPWQKDPHSPPNRTWTPPFNCNPTRSGCSRTGLWLLARYSQRTATWRRCTRRWKPLLSVCRGFPWPRVRGR
jgi:hypothetical protein